MVNSALTSSGSEVGRPAPATTEEAGTDLITCQLSRARLYDPNSNTNNNTAATADPNITANNNKNAGRGNSIKKVHKLSIDGDDGDRDFLKCAEMIANIICSRQAYKDCDKGELEHPFETDASEFFAQLQGQHHGDGCVLKFDGGVYRFNGMKTKIVPWETYMRDVKAVFSAIESGPCLSTARTRLTTIAEKSQLYFLLNGGVELSYNKDMLGGGVYAVCTRVDNAVHLPTSVTAPTLLDFIITTAVEQPRTPLFYDEQGRVVHLMEYLESCGVTDPSEITGQGLGLQPVQHRKKLQQYNVLDTNLNPSGKFGAHLLQAIFSTSGPKEGDLLGALIRPELEKREFKERHVVATEILFPLYGQNAEELQKLAAWVRRQGFNSFELNMWTLCIPRSAPLCGPNEQPVTCVTLGDQLRHIFYPMFMATLYPMDAAWADVAALLRKTGGISIRPEHVFHTQNFLSHAVDPDEIKYGDMVNDHYFFYYIWANLASLNALRTRLGLNTLNFSPSVFEVAPAYDQLVSSFLLADVVYHATSLEKSWIMQYLFMYCRIGVVMSPLRDNTLGMSYFDHPFVRYLSQGLLVSVTTSDPLYFHHSASPLVEEYATLMKLHSLLPMDLCEIARNSVLNSNFPLKMKRRWLGDEFQGAMNQGNDIRRSGVCDARLEFRSECLLHEETILNLVLSQVCKEGEQPLSLSFISTRNPARLSVEECHHSCGGRRLNYTDWRIVYPRIDIVGGQIQAPAIDAVELLREVISLRTKYVKSHVIDVDVKVEDVFSDSKFDESKWEYNNYYGVFLLSRTGKSPPWPTFIPSVREFIGDVAAVREAVMSHRGLQVLADQRLQLLERKFLLHLSLNISKEAGAKTEKEWNNRDFFTAHKVDTNVQTAAGMNARTLLEFFVEKALHHGHDVVFEEDNQPVTLRQVLERCQINATRITVDELNHLISSNPRIRNTFLEVDNFMKGRYFAELTKRTLELYQEDAFSFSENRLVIKGASKDEWWKLAQWFDRYGMASSHNRWMINLPRQYRRLRQEGVVRNFGEYIDNMFQPLWEISLHPAQDTKLHYFLTHVSGMDCVGDESKIDLPLTGTYPHDWDNDLNPPYNLYLYYYWANITTLNEFRASRGLGTFSFRPQCGELGGVEHLIGGFLLANGINHGVTLSQKPVLEYMYYITQLGVAMSPLSNTAAASAYLSNPFPLFFRRGLNVSLATNEPLYFHFTREPLIEEYSIAAKIWQFEFNDLSEIARNSVKKSGFPPTWKENALGKLYHLNSALGNDVRKSRVSDIRVAYRYETYHSELDFLSGQLSKGRSMPRAMRLLEEEIAIYEEVMLTKVVMPAAADEDEGREETRSPVARAVRLKAELEALERDMQRMKLLTMQVRNENRGIVEAFNRIRAKLNTEGLIVMGNLTNRPASPKSNGVAAGNTNSGVPENHAKASA
ncbi:adenosine monophosphate deaminase-like protein [Trypanosoma rangeli]|uniref:Adenosine monophosphate deaminase-like protein n=1 Tax=Trypanosoma rangeli TaxID=5698 RepID=A0A3R7NE24_TRYRA|nr:adenosine monophosphate deaminase-like protein [Trypanosoma rangeli]RNF05084.1 adenosine monophosphate deaminase-like protein [Trypanosoma rangeli]|eukprot:RNF05084.1 adenosine monophosphate deaminase-like protein [Trypanosoma rangeli]